MPCTKHFKTFRGKEGKDAATISFGEDGNQNWFLGHLYYGGNPSPDLYISKKSTIYDGKGSFFDTGSHCPFSAKKVSLPFLCL
ncbi:MAG: hypothetical protein GKR88_00130 [Flavobacteriaceae bacterium]|nr:MAG: hypothetical protein GKR88_00130 [Flavobacteriaceae bacterium]